MQGHILSTVADALNSTVSFSGNVARTTSLLDLRLSTGCLQEDEDHIGVWRERERERERERARVS
jgi:hypothetical protein